jgi:hypothetical protein
MESDLIARSEDRRENVLEDGRNACFPERPVETGSSLGKVVHDEREGFVEGIHRSDRLD